MTRIDHPPWLRLTILLLIWTNFCELRNDEVRRTTLPRTRVNKPLSHLLCRIDQYCPALCSICVMPKLCYSATLVCNN
jgi:hypothetical protein